VEGETGFGGLSGAAGNHSRVFEGGGVNCEADAGGRRLFLRKHWGVLSNGEGKEDCPEGDGGQDQVGACSTLPS